MTAQNPVVVVPGITATELVDEYPLDIEVVWSMLLHREFERVALHPDDLRYEAVEPAWVRTRQVFGLYDDLVASLRHELSPTADEPTPVFAFGYDWRADIRDAADSLEEFVDEVLARARLLRHYRRAGKSLRVDLVGHSMGGLVILEYLARARKNASVGKVATLGTPFLGSVEAVVKVATGLSLLTGSEPKEREREAARVTPSIYQLFPSFSGSATDGEGNEVDLFDGSNMQATVVESLGEFIRLFSSPSDPDTRYRRARGILDGLLASARDHRATVESFKPAVAGLRLSDWLAVVGIGEPTRCRVVVADSRAGVRFSFEEATPTKPDTLAQGDGTVHLESATPPFLPLTHPVCVAEDDLGFFELGDRALAHFGGLHATLPRMNLVQRLVAKHLVGERYRPAIWGRRLPAARAWNPPIPGLSERDPIENGQTRRRGRRGPARRPR